MSSAKESTSDHNSIDCDKRDADLSNILQQNENVNEKLRPGSENGSSVHRRNDQEKQGSASIPVPDGGYGWVMVLCCFLFNISTWAANSGFSVYLAYYLHNDTFKGATKLDYAAVGGMSFGIGLLFTPFILYFKDITSIKIILTIGCLFQLCGTILASFSTELWQIYLSQGVLVGFGLAFIATPASVLLSQWFRDRRSLAISISSSGSGIGGIMFNLAIQAIIKNYGLRWALLTQGLICTLLTAIAIWMVKTRDSEYSSTFAVYDVQILRSQGFHWFVMFVMFTLLGYVILLYNLVDFTKSLGYSSTEGSIVSCMVSAGAFVGRPVFGAIADKHGPVTSSMAAHFIISILCFTLWIFARSLTAAIIFAFLQGCLMGSIWVCLPSILTRVAGLRKLPIASGMSFMVIGAFGILSPIIGLVLRGDAPLDQEYSPTQYRSPAIFCGFTVLLSAIMLWMLRSYFIARDITAIAIGSNSDSNEMGINVSFQKLVSKMLSKSTSRKV